MNNMRWIISLLLLVLAGQGCHRKESSAADKVKLAATTNAESSPILANQPDLTTATPLVKEVTITDHALGAIAKIDPRTAEVFDNPGLGRSERVGTIISELIDASSRRRPIDSHYDRFMFWVWKTNAGGWAGSAHSLMLKISPTSEGRVALSSLISTGQYSLLDVALQWKMSDFTSTVRSALSANKIQGKVEIYPWTMAMGTRAQDSAFVRCRVGMDDLARAYLIYWGDEVLLKEFQEQFQQAPQSVAEVDYPNVKDKWYYHSLLTIAGHQPDEQPLPKPGIP